MNKKEFKTQVIREDEYWISFDQSIWNETRIAEYSKVFRKVENLEDVAHDVAFMLMRNGSGNFFEGFGHVKTFDTNGYKKTEKVQFYQGMILDESDYCEGIAIFIKSEDTEIEVKVSEKEVFI